MVRVGVHAHAHERLSLRAHEATDARLREGHEGVDALSRDGGVFGRGLELDDRAVGLVVAFLLADFLSGLVHVLCDNLGSPWTPFVGQKFIKAFREHVPGGLIGSW